MSDDNVLLKIYVSSTDKLKHKPLYEVIVYAAKRYNLKGATVLKGIMGFGSNSEIYSNKLWEISEKIPLIIEIIDERDKINEFIAHIKPYLQNANGECLITLTNLRIV